MRCSCQRKENLHHRHIYGDLEFFAHGKALEKLIKKNERIHIINYLRLYQDDYEFLTIIEHYRNDEDKNLLAIAMDRYDEHVVLTLLDFGYGILYPKDGTYDKLFYMLVEKHKIYYRCVIRRMYYKIRGTFCID